MAEAGDAIRAISRATAPNLRHNIAADSVNPGAKRSARAVLRGGFHNY
jgi:hypothetical protein